MTYAVHEMFYSLQGEGYYTGRPAVFVRFAGCNLWSGFEEDRATGKGTCALWCDTQFVGTSGIGGGKFKDPIEVVDAIKKLIFQDSLQTAKLLVVCTGGEPLLQLDKPLVDALRNEGFEVAIETNGTKALPEGGVDWVCLSPKVGMDRVLQTADEVKLVYPQKWIEPEDFDNFDAKHFFLQPLDDANLLLNTKAAVEYILKHPKWRLSLQTHKLLGLR